MRDLRVLAFVLAGGEGRRLRPLTEHCAKPAVELGHGFRIIDFVLANLVNSRVSPIYLLAQYKPAPLIEHVARVWRPALVRRGCLLTPVIPHDPYTGTADAVPLRIPGDPDHAYASMGNYLFDPIALFDLLEESAARGGSDFGRDVLPRAVRGRARVFAYDFSTNRVPGLKAYEDPTYWRDVGTVQALAQARQDVEGGSPRFDLRNADWPLQPAGAE